MARPLFFGAQNPAHPWWAVAERVVELLVGFHEPLLPETRVAVMTPPDLQGARWNPTGVAEGILEIGITTPAAAAAMAQAGTGVYDRPSPELRALASFPHIDCIVFAVDAHTGIESFEQLVEERYPLRLVTGRRSAAGGDDILTFSVEEVLKAYGASYADIEAWGGRVVYGGPTHIGGRLLLEPDTADALFQEARTQGIWHEIAERRDLNLLSVRTEIIEELGERYGLGGFTIQSGDYRGVDEPVPTVDFSGWLLFTRSDLPFEQAYAIASACATVADRADDLPADVRRSLRMPIEVDYLFRESGIELHEGAAAYAHEHGHLTTAVAAG